VKNFTCGNETGGLSGQPLHQKTLEMIHRIRRFSQNKLPIIAVGGIVSGTTAVQFLKAGASLVQIYTGLVYRGPRLIREIVRASTKSNC
jgi:dihydroorotate dehydrogenase